MSDGTLYALCFDEGEQVFEDYPAERDIELARAVAPYAWTRIDQLVGGWDRQTLHEWPPYELDPRPRRTDGVRDDYE